MRAFVGAALTPDQWVEFKRRLAEAEARTTQEKARIEILATWNPRDMFGIAAIALYGQPAGFRWFMADHLREAIEVARASGMSPEAIYGATAALECIEALLPPRET